MALLERDGVKLYYEAHGAGPTVLLSHGYSATTEMWTGQIEPLTNAGYQVVTWDMRGHGQTEAGDDPARYSPELTIDDMVAVLDTVGADTAVIAGLSLGGYMSLAFNVAHPERVRALMLFDTGPGFRKDEARQQWNDTSEKTAQSAATEGLALAARGILKQKDASVMDSLPTIAVPTLVLVGEKDVRFHGGTDYMAAKIPKARKVVIPDAGHAANIDQPDAFNRAVVEFLAEVR